MGTKPATASCDGVGRRAKPQAKDEAGHPRSRLYRVENYARASQFSFGIGLQASAIPVYVPWVVIIPLGIPSHDTKPAIGIGGLSVAGHWIRWPIRAAPEELAISVPADHPLRHIAPQIEDRILLAETRKLPTSFSSGASPGRRAISTASRPASSRLGA